ncbi:uncharacterized protein LOC134204120 [Armigeres subalbatus]|uniref:uncharacterized protein LOC134204120 n=1 Tax=Armigeres subalbatus TaxID=124917 RepID=UPI002ED2E02C
MERMKAGQKTFKKQLAVMGMEMADLSTSKVPKVEADPEERQNATEDDVDSVEEDENADDKVFFEIIEPELTTGEGNQIARFAEDYEAGVNEGIDDLQTFLELDSGDFARLKLCTKVIKFIQRVQKEFYDDPVLEERLEECDEDVLDEVPSAVEEPDETQYEETTPDGSNDYRGIVLQTIIDVNVIFKRTSNGREIIELLKEGLKPNDSCMSAIKRILCDYLKSAFGLRPSAYHKNLLAKSLVHTYPALSSTTLDVPQALWFHPNGRGKHRHSGRLHYHMEYLARTSGNRIINRRKLQVEEIKIEENDSGICSAQDIDLDAVTQELKFLCPGPNTKLRAEELWHLTFHERQDLRLKKTFFTYLETYPVATAFNGCMILLEFRTMHPNAPDFTKKLICNQNLYRAIASSSNT